MSAIEQRIKAATIPVRTYVSKYSSLTIGEYDPLTSTKWLLIPSTKAPEIQVAAMAHEFYSHPHYYGYKYKESLFREIFIATDREFAQISRFMARRTERAALISLYFNNRSAYKAARINMTECYPQGNEIAEEATVLIEILESLFNFVESTERRHTKSEYIRTLVRLVDWTGPHAVERILTLIEYAPPDVLESHLRSPSKLPFPKEVEKPIWERIMYDETVMDLFWMLHLIEAGALLLESNKDLAIVLIAHIFSKLLVEELTYAARLIPIHNRYPGNVDVTPLMGVMIDPAPGQSFFSSDLSTTLLKTNRSSIRFLLNIYSIRKFREYLNENLQKSEEPWDTYAVAATEAICSTFDELHKAYLLWTTKKKETSGVGYYFELLDSEEWLSVFAYNDIRADHFLANYNSQFFHEHVQSMIDSTYYLRSDINPKRNEIKISLMRQFRGIKGVDRRAQILELFAHEPDTINDIALIQKQISDLYWKSVPPIEETMFYNAVYLKDVPTVFTELIKRIVDDMRDHEDIVVKSRLFKKFPYKWWRHKFIPF